MLTTKDHAPSAARFYPCRQACQVTAVQAVTPISAMVMRANAHVEDRADIASPSCIAAAEIDEDVDQPDRDVEPEEDGEKHRPTPTIITITAGTAKAASASTELEQALVVGRDHGPRQSSDRTLRPPRVDGKQDREQTEQKHAENACRVVFHRVLRKRAGRLAVRGTVHQRRCLESISMRGAACDTACDH
jgi:hypothetical protein